MRDFSLLSILFLTASLLTQPTAGAQQRLFFDTVDVRIVNLEVVVTDKEGHAVTGLSRDDFLVLEDGQAVEISNFFAVRGREIERSAPTNGVAKSSDEAVEPETRRLNLVVFVDNLNMQPRNRNALFRELESYIIDRFDRRDRMAIVTLGEGIEIVQQFSSDPAELLDAIARLERDAGSLRRGTAELQILLRNIQRAVISENPAVVGSSGPPSLEWEQAALNADRLARDVSVLAEIRYQTTKSTIKALEAFCDSLAGMPGRKALLYLSDGLPLRPADALAQAWLNKFEDWIYQQQVTAARASLRDMVFLSGGSRFDASNDFDRLVDHASASQVVFYPISNARGLRSTGISAEHQGAGTTSGSGAFSANVAALEALSQDASLLQMAEGTGGVAFTSTTNLDGLLDRVVRDFDSFYSIGFSPPHGDDGKIHDLEVRLRDRSQNYTVRHLSAHRERDPVENLAALVLSALHFAAPDNALDVGLEPISSEPVRRRRHRVTIMVRIPFDHVVLLPDGEFHVGQVSLVVAVRDEETGGVSSPQRIDLPIRIPASQVGQLAQQAVGYPLQLEIEAGTKLVMVGVRDHLARLDATVATEITVPLDQPSPSSASDR